MTTSQEQFAWLKGLADEIAAHEDDRGRNLRNLYRMLVWQETYLDAADGPYRQMAYGLYIKYRHRCGYAVRPGELTNVQAAEEAYRTWREQQR